MNDQQWSVFGLVEQEKLRLPAISKILGIEIQEIKDIIQAIKKEHPYLFFFDSERQHLANKISGQERKRRNMKLVSYESRNHDGENMADTEIKQKF